METELKPRDHAEQVARFRAGIVNALAHRDLARGERRAELLRLSQQRFRAPDAPSTRTYSFPTLERWFDDFRRGGLDALRPRPRSDRGRARDLPDATRQLLLDIRREHPTASAALIVRTLVLDGRLERSAVSVPTVRRLYAEHGLDRVAARDGAGPKTRLRWQADRPNALWHGDVCHRPALTIDGTSRPLRIHALLDDASRYVVALEAHHTEREVDMLGLFVAAMRRHGPCDALYLDNGSTYRGEALQIATARLGISLLRARPYDPQARGKMERFWRTLREGCLAHLGPMTSLHDVICHVIATGHLPRWPSNSRCDSDAASVRGYSCGRVTTRPAGRRSVIVEIVHSPRNVTSIAFNGVAGPRFVARNVYATLAT